MSEVKPKRAYNPEAYARNREARLTSQKAYYERTREARLKYQNEYNSIDENRIKASETKREYNQRDIESHRAYCREYNQRNYEAHKTYNREYYQANIEARRAYNREYAANRRKAIKEQAAQ